MSHDTTQMLKAQLRDELLKATPDQRPEMLIRLCLLYGAQSNSDPDEITALMEELREEFGISESEIHDAIAASPLLSEI